MLEYEKVEHNNWSVVLKLFKTDLLSPGSTLLQKWRGKPAGSNIILVS